MYFYVDESGQTGLNLLDSAQPEIFYGTVSCLTDIDVDALQLVLDMRKALGVTRIHASELGQGRLGDFAGSLLTAVRMLNIKFDVYKLVKRDCAVVQIFDSLFDSFDNPAVPRTAYITPMRYPLLLGFATLFDDDLLRRAWVTRISKNKAAAYPALSSLCKEIGERAAILQDPRMKEIIEGAMRWASLNTEAFVFHASDKAEQKFISPNTICFQFVMLGIASRLKEFRTSCSRITVDQQHEFNSSQGRLANHYAGLSGANHPLGIGLPMMDMRNMPTTPLTVSGGDKSPGLELVDIFLWLFRQRVAGKLSHPGLRRLLADLVVDCTYDEMSLQAISNRWSKFFAELPEPTPEAIEKGSELMQEMELKRLKALSDLQA